MEATLYGMRSKTKWPKEASKPQEGFVDHTVYKYRMNPDGSKGELLGTEEGVKEIMTNWPENGGKMQIINEPIKEEKEPVKRQRKAKYSEADKQKAIELRLQYKNYDEICRELGISKAVIARWLGDKKLIEANPVLKEITHKLRSDARQRSNFTMGSRKKEVKPLDVPDLDRQYVADKLKQYRGEGHAFGGGGSGEEALKKHAAMQRAKKEEPTISIDMPVGGVYQVKTPVNQTITVSSAGVPNIEHILVEAQHQVNAVLDNPITREILREYVRRGGLDEVLLTAEKESEI